MIEWILMLAGGFAALEVYDFFFLRKQTGSLRVAGVFVLVAIALAMPYLVPSEMAIVRFMIAMAVFNKIFKSIEIAYGRMVDPAMTETFGRFLFWSLNFPDTKFPTSPEEAQNNRREGRMRILRFFPKAFLLAGLFAATSWTPWIESHYWAKTLWLCLVGYLSFSGAIDFVTGTMMQSGIYFYELFDAPLVARSPREFWGRRWNLYFRDVTHRNIFLPLGGTKRPLLAVIAVFAISALLHEYLVFVSIGFSMAGYMSLFFALQCFATIAQSLVKKWTGKKHLFPRPIGVLLTLTWILCTAPLLAEPMLKIFPLFSVRLW